MDSENTSELNSNSIKKFSHNDRKILIKRISDVKNKKCYIKIFKIIHNNNNSYTKNDNGIFFNITNLSDDILNQIEHIIKHYEMKKYNSEIRLIQSLTNSTDITEDSITSDIQNNNYIHNNK